MFSSDFFLLKREYLIHTSQQNIIDFYDIYPIKIGEGNDAVIYKAKQFQSWGKDRAVKKIHKSYIDNREYLKNQINVLKKLDHPGIIKLYQIFQDEQYYFIVTELCEGDDLLKLLRKKGQFNEQQAKPLFKKIIQIVSYCHANKVIHRDIKLQNLVFSTKNAIPNNIKLIDFGMSFNWKSNLRKQIQQTFSTNKIVGTIYYLAPQIFNEVYGPEVDIWSAGVVLYFLVTGTLPFWSDYSDEILIQNIKNRRYQLQQLQLSEELKDLLNRIFQLQHKRITVKQIIHHPWFHTNQQQESKKLTPEKLHYFSLIPFKQVTNYKQILNFYHNKLSPSKQLDQHLKEDYNFYFLNWQRIHNFIYSSKIDQAITIFLTNRLNTKKMQKYQIIFNQYKEAIKETISIKTLKIYLNFQFQYQRNVHIHQNNHISNPHNSEKRQPQTHKQLNQAKNYFQKQKICKEMLQYFTQNQNQTIGYTHFISWIINPNQFNMIQINYIKDQLQRSYKIIGNLEVNMVIKQIQSTLIIKLKEDQKKTKSEAYYHFNTNTNKIISFDNKIPHPAKGLANNQIQQNHNYTRMKSLTKAKHKNSVKHAILSSISPSFKRKQQSKVPVIKKMLMKQKQSDNKGFLGLGKIKQIIMEIPFF